MERTLVHSWTFPRALLLCSLAILPGCSGESAPPVATNAALKVNADTARADSVQGTPVTEVLAATTATAAVLSAKSAPSASADVPGAATDAELLALRAEMGMPVVGVKPSDLRDTYTEPRTGHTHEALDIPAPRGTPVVSAAPGRLLKIFESKAGGHMVYAADESDRFILMYAHLDHYADGLKEGMPLVRGQALGFVGTSGNAPPNLPHLHFAISRGTPSRKWWVGTPLDPFPLLAH